MHNPFLNRWLVKIWDRWARSGSEGRPQFEFGDIRLTLRHNWRYRLSLSFVFLLLAGLCWFSWMKPEEFQDRPLWVLWFVRLTLSVLMPIGLVEIAGAFRHRVVLDEAGIVITPALGRAQRVHWAEVDLMIDETDRETISILTKSGRKHKVSTFLRGYEDLRDRIKAIENLDR